jgi:hypothetical protein
MPGAVREISDEEIFREFADCELVVRGIPEWNLHPRAGGGRRVSQAAFSASSKGRDKDQGMSVDRMRILQLMYDDPTDQNQYASAMAVLMTLKVQDLTELGLEIRSAPKPGNPAHCNVLGVKSNNRKRLLNMAGWLRRSADVDV